MSDDLQSLRIEMRKLLDEQDDRINALDQRTSNLQEGVSQVLSGAYNEIVNLLDDSLPEWSSKAYTNLGILPTDAGDTNLEAYAWYRQVIADTILSQSSAHALKAVKTIEPADHSLWAANEAVTADIPRWDKVNSWIEFGGLTHFYDLFTAIPNDIIFPGQIFYVQFEAMLAGVNDLPAGVQFYIGCYDSTAGQEKYLEGGSFAITDDQGNAPGVTLGVPGAVSVNYKVIAYTDSGETAESNTLNFPNAPATFNADNHPIVHFGGVPGFIKFEIYREIAGAYVLQFVVQNSFDLSYADIGNPPVRVVDAFPSAPTTKPRAFAITSRFMPGHEGGAGWVRHTLTIFVPLTYNRSLTTSGKQSLRMGLSAATAVARQVRIRKVGFSMGNGKWARSAYDIRSGAHSSPSTTATASGGGGSGGIGPPPGGGGGGDDPPGGRGGNLGF